MKNKSLTYVLLIVVGIIWYQVFFRIKSNFEENTVINSNNVVNYPSNLKINRDTFKIILPIRDPFYGKIILNNFSSTKYNQTQTNLQTKTNQAKPIKQITNWFSIEYFGMIKKNDSKNPLAIIKIDHELFHLRKGEEAFDGYKVVSIYADSVLISFNESLKIFLKKR